MIVWYPEIAKAWCLQAGGSMAREALASEETCEALWSSIGTLLFAGLTGEGTGSEQDLDTYLRIYCGWLPEIVREHVKELRNAMSAPSPSRYERMK